MVNQCSMYGRQTKKEGKYLSLFLDDFNCTLLLTFIQLVLMTKQKVRLNTGYLADVNFGGREGVQGN